MIIFEEPIVDNNSIRAVVESTRLSRRQMYYIWDAVIRICTQWVFYQTKFNVIKLRFTIIIKI